MYKQSASFHIEAALYRISLERRCKKNDGTWAVGVPAHILLALEDSREQFSVLGPETLVRYQHVVEVACEYLRANPSREAALGIISAVQDVLNDTFREISLRLSAENQTIPPEIPMLLYATATNIVKSFEELVQPDA
jgi:hypothetical protein